MSGEGGDLAACLVIASGCWSPDSYLPTTSYGHLALGAKAQGFSDKSA